MDRRPSFFIVGAAKAGTTALWSWLRRHPDIFLPEVKETNYFSLGGKEQYHKGSELDPNYHKTFVRSEADYLRLFRNAPKTAICGEASPSYLYYKQTAERIRTFESEAKIIVIFRNPVERAFSQFMHHVRDGYETMRSFESALEAEEERRARGWWWGFHYRAAGMYADQWRAFKSAFPSQNLLVLSYDDLQVNPASAWSKVCGFLNIPIEGSIDFRRRVNSSGDLARSPAFPCITRWERHPSQLKSTVRMLLPFGVRKKLKSLIARANWIASPELSEEVTRLLAQYYRTDLEKLTVLTGGKFRHWGRPDRNDNLALVMSSVGARNGSDRVSEQSVCYLDDGNRL